MTTPVIRSTAPLCGPRLMGGLSTRRGFPAGDDADPERGRAELRGRLATALHHPSEAFAWCKQVHGAGVRDVEEPGLQGEADAMVTTRAELGLLIAVADCAPVLFWDASVGVLGAAHAGWRGLVAGVLEATVERMREAGASPSRIHAWIGPRISLEHFEVGEEVAEQFAPEEVHRRADWERPHVDLGAAAHARLLRLGLEPARVGSSPDCTFAQPELYHSYRRDRGICGRHLAYLLRTD